MATKSDYYPIRQYRELEPREQLVVFGDPADSNDYCAAVACSKKYNDFPLIMNMVTESPQFGYEIEHMCKYIYNRTGIWPKLAIERNTGQATIFVLRQLNYPDLFRMVDFTAQNSAERGNIGWVTTGYMGGGSELQGTRRKMLDDLALAIKQGILKIYDEEQLRQLKSFMYIKGKARAKQGTHDDLVIACYSDDTDVLTTTGWKKIWEVSVGEQVYSLNPETKQSEIATNMKTTYLPYKGKMVHFNLNYPLNKTYGDDIKKSWNALDFMVTPNHNMLKFYSIRKKFNIRRADFFINKNSQMPIKAVLPGEYPKEICGINSDLAMYFIGHFTKYGMFHEEKISLHYGENRQGTKGDGLFKKIFTLFNKNNIPCEYNLGVFMTHDKRIIDILNTHLKIKNNRSVSMLPVMFKYDGNLLLKFFEGVLEKTPAHIYGYPDKKMAYDAVEIGIRAGYFFRPVIRGVEGLQSSYVLRVVNSSIHSNSISISSDNVKYSEYNGYVTCLTLDKNHFMLVRRNETYMWSGNTAGAWQVNQVTPSIENFERDDYDMKKSREKWRFK